MIGICLALVLIGLYCVFGIAEIVDRLGAIRDLLKLQREERQ